MTSLITDIVSAVLQVLLFTLVPFVVFVFRRDKAVGFARYLGFTTPPRRAVRNSVWVVLAMVTAAVGVIALNDHVRAVVLAPQSVTGRLRLTGPSASSVVTLLLIAIVKTSLAEEIFFRGFLAKQVVRALGFAAGNVTQSLVFGAVHLLLFRALVGGLAVPLAFIFAFSTIGGWLIGYIKEKQAAGSIIPGWIAHATANVLSYAIIAFVI